MYLPKPMVRTFKELLNDIEKGQIKIPQFQREFVWDLKKSANLMDSIIKGYPIGTLIFWKTKERLRAIRDIGNHRLPIPEEGDFIEYVLDGQQRLTSLFASLKGVKIEREYGKIDDYAEMYINLEAKEDEDIVITVKEGVDERSLIRITDLLYGGIILLSHYPHEFLQKLEDFKTRIESYNYSTILITEASIDIATEIFTRINVGGKPLSVFEIMVAKTFDPEQNFDLAERYKKLIEDLTPINFETISDATVLQTVSIILEKECAKKQILKLNKYKFIKIWDDLVDSMERAIEYFRGFYRIPVSQLLPYNALIVPFAYFFYHHKDRPTGNKQKYLQDYFWRVSLSGRYSSGLEGKLAQDIKKIDLILNDELPKYDWGIDISPDFIVKNGWFNAGRGYVKAILCIYAYQQPKSFNDNSIVNISNYWLKQANSKNYHHFFPRAYLKKKGIDYWDANHILNITIVDDYLNKREIGAKSPSKYMKRFYKANKKHIDETMMTHLIGDLEKFGVFDDDYEKFIHERAKFVSKELKKRIIEQEIDKTGQDRLIDMDNDISESD
jgi:hypothetical protein